MTTICFDGITLAADKQCTIYNTPTKVTKIYKVVEDGDTFLYGCAGNATEAYAFHLWTIGELEQRPKLSNIQIIMIDYEKTVYIADKNLIYLPIQSKKWAIGSGGDYALGAMYAGKTAKEAVKIASQLDVYTGNAVDTLTF